MLFGLRFVLAHLGFCGVASLRIGYATKTQKSQDWVEKMLQTRESWEPVVKECSEHPEDLKQSVANPPQLEKERESFHGILDYRSDLSPAMYAAIDEMYTSSGDSSTFIKVQDLPHPNPQGNLKVDASMLTRVKCIDTFGSPELNTSTCEFTNLYAYKATLIAHILEGDAFPEMNMRVRLNGFGEASNLDKIVKVVRHQTQEDFAAYFAGGINKIYDGMTLGFTPKWHFNIGHGMYDSMYPSFLSLVQFGKHIDNFRVLLHGTVHQENVEAKVPGGFAKVEQILGQVGGNGVVVWVTDPRKQNDLPEHALFESIVLGSGLNGQKLDMNGDFALGGGRQLDGARLFRTKVYKTFGIQPRDVQRPRRERIRGLIIHNKRFETRQQLQPQWTLDVIEKAASEGVDLEYFNWKGDFESHMRKFSQTDLHISAPGTAQMFQHFLPDGAVHINLGVGFSEDAAGQFFEEYMAEGAPYIRALYQWSKNNKDVASPPESQTRVITERVTSLVLQAKALLKNGFEIPVPPNSNLSPVLRVLKVYEHFTQRQDQIRTQTPICFLKPKYAGYNTRFFGNGFPQSFVSSIVERYKPIHLNQCLLKKLTESYGEPCEGCEWFFPSHNHIRDY